MLCSILCDDMQQLVDPRNVRIEGRSIGPMSSFNSYGNPC
jgi:hypothetical protein